MPIPATAGAGRPTRPHIPVGRPPGRRPGTLPKSQPCCWAIRMKPKLEQPAGPHPLPPPETGASLRLQLLTPPSHRRKRQRDREGDPARVDPPSPPFASISQDSSQLQRCQSQYGKQNAQDVKTRHHLALVPTQLLEVMMQRRHQKDTPPRACPETRVTKVQPLNQHR